MAKKISIIIPVFNEEKTILNIVEKVQKVKIFDLTKEIIIVNDASTDKTKEIIQSLILKNKNIIFIENEKNLGKGASIRKGFEHSSGDYLVIQDADLEYNPQDLRKLIKPILDEEIEVVYGSRLLGKITGFQISSHYYGNKILSFITSVLYKQKITDMETCYKMMKKEVLEGINLKANKFDIEPEITAKIIKKGYKIKEIPIDYNARSFIEGKKINWKDGLFALNTLVKYRFFD
jgi:dolichol-phosphate mannosyltransferase